MSSAGIETGIFVDSIIKQAANQVSSNLADEVIILNLQSGTYYGLNSVGARIWNLIQEPVALHEVLSILLEEYEVMPKRCEADLLILIEQLTSKGLIEVQNAVQPYMLIRKKLKK